MTLNSPGGISPPDENMLSPITFHLSTSSKALLNSMHQLSPIHRDAIDNLEQEINSLRSQFQNDPEMVGEINELARKIMSIKKKKMSYAMTDFGPFVVIVESKIGNVGNIHPMDLGKVLHQLNINGIVEIKRKGVNRLGIRFSTAKDANNFLSNKKFLEKGYVAYVPQRLLTCRGIIRDVGLTVTIDDILTVTESQAKVTHARRLNRRVVDNGEVKYIPSKTVQITFEGKQLPNEIRIFSLNLKVQPYIAPVQQCFNCLRFGHSKNQCRGKKRCERCGEDHENCTQEPPVCLFCDGNHSATYRKCKEFERQKNINEAMAFHDLSYYEAAQIFPPLKSTAQLNSRRVQDFPLLLNTPTPLSTSQGTESYARITTHAKRRKNAIVESPHRITGYDKQAHKELLLPSSNRSVSLMPKFSQRYPSPPSALRSTEKQKYISSPASSSRGVQGLPDYEEMANPNVITSENIINDGSKTLTLRTNTSSQPTQQQVLDKELGYYK